MTDKIRVLLAEDHKIVRQGLRKLIEEQSIDVVDEVDNGQDAVSRARDLAPDVVVMDISMPVMRGIEATSRIKKDNPAGVVDAITGVTITSRAMADAVRRILDDLKETKGEGKPR